MEIALDEQELEMYMKAGEIACRALRYGASLVKEGAKLIDIAENVENHIRSLGGEPAFPVNISINQLAAHYTPTPNDDAVVPAEAVVKLDVGVHVDGYIADTATTVSLNPVAASLVDACREALERGLKVVGAGTKFSEFGRVVENVIKSRGFKPIYNLGGHGLDRYSLHSGEVVPNHYEIANFSRFRDGRAYALEPFATNGVGFVRDGPAVTIYALRFNPKRVKQLSERTRKFFEEVYSKRRGLPFAIRWYVPRYGDEIREILAELRRSKLLIEYPVLIERGGGLVAQFEHTVVIYKGRVYVTTQC